MEAYCPCCGDPMNQANVVCWECYQITNRLQPGTHLDLNGTTLTVDGYAVEITQANIDQWEAEKTARMAEVKVNQEFVYINQAWVD